MLAGDHKASSGKRVTVTRTRMTMTTATMIMDILLTLRNNNTQPLTLIHVRHTYNIFLGSIIAFAVIIGPVIYTIRSIYQGYRKAAQGHYSEKGNFAKEHVNQITARAVAYTVAYTVISRSIGSYKTFSPRESSLTE